LAQFSLDDCLSFFRSLGIMPKEKGGYYYPNSMQASSVRDALEFALKNAGVAIECGINLIQVQSADGGFLCRTENKNFHGKNIVFATGLYASPKLGSDGSAIPLIESLGHTFTDIRPALCGFYAEGLAWRRVAGVRTDAALDLYIGGRRQTHERGQLQLTEYGVSGIPVFQLSSFAVRAMSEEKIKLRINFLPDMDFDGVFAELSDRLKRWGDLASSGQILCGMINDKLAAACLSAVGISIKKPLREQDIARLTDILTNCEIRLVKPRGMEQAQVCAGGIKGDEIDHATLESRLMPGLYFCGELLDADGICGGYNLHWAWATGHIVGKNIR
ncbi:MAG: aminoacetone oxidase family FAD-binding enzyme, partial [Clostridiales bacterium]|nr:aminoacetone oxidase family FAD-binding enzyme [Clostridiales bacterium]